MKVEVRIQTDNKNMVNLNGLDFTLKVDSTIELTTLIDIIFKNGYNVLIKKIGSDKD